MTGDGLVWPLRLLRAAYWVVRVLGEEGEVREVAHRSWLNLPLAGEVDIEELARAEHGLIVSGLVAESSGRLCVDRRVLAACGKWSALTPLLLLTILVEAVPPLWLLTAARERTRPQIELIPDDALAALESVIPDPAQREAFLLARAQTVDARASQALGEAGELFVERACRHELAALGRDDLAEQVRRVSSISDELGFDVVAPRCDGTLRRMEVKSTRSSARDVSVYLTRNEFMVGTADPDWCLTVVRIDRDERHEVLGHLAGVALVELVPTDRHERGRWSAARLSLSVDAMEPGLPAPR